MGWSDLFIIIAPFSSQKSYGINSETLVICIARKFDESRHKTKLVFAALAGAGVRNNLMVGLAQHSTRAF